MDFIQRLQETSKRGAGRVLVARLIVNTEKREAVFVPDSVNHPPFLAVHLGTSVDELKQRPAQVSPFVSVVLKREDNRVAEVLVGVSGLETIFRSFKSPLHTKEQVNTARDLIQAILVSEGILAEGYKMKVVYL